MSNSWLNFGNPMAHPCYQTSNVGIYLSCTNTNPVRVFPFFSAFYFRLVRCKIIYCNTMYCMMITRTGIYVIIWLVWFSSDISTRCLCIHIFFFTASCLGAKHPGSIPGACNLASTRKHWDNNYIVQRQQAEPVWREGLDFCHWRCEFKNSHSFRCK